MFALGTFISVTDRSDQANNIDLGVGMMLASVGNDGSPLVRKVGTHDKFLYLIHALVTPELSIAKGCNGAVFPDPAIGVPFL